MDNNNSVTSDIDLHQIISALEHLRQENNELRDIVSHLQTQPRPPTPPALSIETKHREPKIALPEKFDGSRSKFRGFLNQIRLIIQLHPQRYPNDTTQVGLIGSLLTGTALAWIAPLIESNDAILRNFPAFVHEFEATFGETDKARVAANRIRLLVQGNRSASTYASEFRQLSCDLSWNDEALISQFRTGLRSDVKDLLLTLPDPVTLTEAIAQAVRCDNRLFERRHETRVQGNPVRYPYPGPAQTRTPAPTTLGPIPMEVDTLSTSQPRAPLTEAEKQRRRINHLCLYCGQPGHIARICPAKASAPARAVISQVTDSGNANAQGQ